MLHRYVYLLFLQGGAQDLLNLMTLCYCQIVMVMAL